MGKTEKTLVQPRLVTIEDYIKQREKSRNDFELFVEKRNANRKIYITQNEEKKRM